MFKKYRALGFIIPILLAITASFIDESRTFLYNELIDNHLDEGDEITSVTITSDMYMQNQRYTVTIEDPAIIKRITEIPFIELKRSFIPSTPSPTEYPHEIRIQGKSSSFSFVFNDSAIHKDKKYNLDVPSALYEAIQSFNLDWEIEK